jgi:hypothetical protein
MNWLGLAKKWESDREVDVAAFDKEITGTFIEVFSKPWVPVLSAMLQVGRKSMVDSIDIDIIQTANALKMSEAWAQKYAEVQARDLGDTHRGVIQQMLTDWTARRLPAPQMAVRAKEVYGLDLRSANSYFAYANGDSKRKDLNGLANRYLEQRANLIGGLHSFTALNFGRQMLFSEGVAAGYIPQNARKVWVTAIDERVCELCGPMDGVAVPVLDRFEVLVPPPRTERGKKRDNVKLVVPPVHPNCRCTLVLDKKFEDGIITRTARFEDNPKHLARLVSRAEDLILR